MPEDRPISSSRVTASDVVRHSFGVVRRGYDPREVSAYLDMVAREMRGWEEREQEYRRQLYEAEQRAQHPVLDEATLTGALGQQTAQVLRKAHEESARLVAESEQRAAAMLREGQERATEAAVQAEATAAERIAESELAATAVRSKTEQDAELILQSAHRDGEMVIHRAREHGRQMVEEAQAARKRVLADLAQRRRLVHVQIEQLRAARDELTAAVMAVRQKFEDITSGLAGAEDAARQAAMAAGQRVPLETHEGERDLVDSSDLMVHQRVEEAGEVTSTAIGEPPVATPFDAEAVTPGTSETPPAPGAETPPAAGAETPPAAGAESAPAGVPSSPAASEMAISPQPMSSPDPPGERLAPVQVGTSEVAAPVEPVVVESSVSATEAEEEDPAVATSRDLDKLFARIRASQIGGEEQAGSGGAAANGDLANEQSDRDAGGDALKVPGATGPEAPGLEPSPDQVLLSRRAELLSPIEERLTRRLKRALQDDQNRILDELRNRSGKWSDDLLPSEMQHRVEFAQAAEGFLQEAATAGAKFAEECHIANVIPTSDTPGSSRQVDLAAVTDELSDTIVTLLRRSLPGGEDGPMVDDVDDASGAISAAFREWRRDRIERLVGDASLRAFSLGSLGALRGDAQVRWVLGGNGVACADCDDNSLAGLVPAGEDFPTGHPIPPAHAGCRCLVAPSG